MFYGRPRMFKGYPRMFKGCPRMFKGCPYMFEGRPSFMQGLAKMIYAGQFKPKTALKIKKVFEGNFEGFGYLY